ncbi:hypothetical protein GCM10010413_12840 [Promicromonospora sukumoe]
MVEELPVKEGHDTTTETEHEVGHQISCSRMGGRGQVARTHFSAIHCMQARPTIESGSSSSDPREALTFAVAASCACSRAPSSDVALAVAHAPEPSSKHTRVLARQDFGPFWVTKILPC